jgi:hypothetical protein
MTWDDIKPWVAKVAPMLGTALGGPLGGAAGLLIGNALGVKDASPDSIKQAIQTGSLSGDQILALKKAEEDFQIQCLAMGYKDKEALAELEFKDRDSARQREVSIKDWTPKALALVYTTGFFLILGWMLKHGTPKDGGGEALLILLGALAAGATQVLNYYFGSSSGSAQKNELLHQSTPIK